jgi:hypothetical protein
MSSVPVSEAYGTGLIGAARALALAAIIAVKTIVGVIQEVRFMSLELRLLRVGIRKFTESRKFYTAILGYSAPVLVVYDCSKRPPLRKQAQAV